MPGRALFDRVVVVDWSAASSPKRGRDSIWVATVEGDECTVDNIATRHECEHLLAGLVGDDAARRTLLGVDFSLGYPAGTAGALGLAGSPWRAMWELLEAEIDDDRRNGNNRFRVAADLNSRLGDATGPFWGRPAAHEFDSLATIKAPATALPEWRAVERVLRARGRRPSSSWQLLGAGCVGSQSLVGIPVLERLRRAGGERVHVWPFTTGLAAPSVGPGELVVAEVWPSLVDFEVLLRSGPHLVRDAAQVEALARHLASLDHNDMLGPMFAPDIDADAVTAVIAEEGWILGAMPEIVAPAAAMAAIGA